MDTSKFMGGGFYSALNPGSPDLPFRPRDQEPARLPPAPPPKNMYVDQLENGRAVLLDDKGNPTRAPATGSMREGMMLDGSQPHDEGASLRARLGAGDDGGRIDLSQPPPHVPLAPGSPGPPIPPAADSMIGQKKTSSQTKRRRIP